MMTLTSASRKNTRREKKWNNINTWDNKHTLQYGFDTKRKIHMACGLPSVNSGLNKPCSCHSELWRYDFIWCWKLLIFVSTMFARIGLKSLQIHQVSDVDTLILYVRKRIAVKPSQPRKKDNGNIKMITERVVNGWNCWNECH